MAETLTLAQPGQAERVRGLGQRIWGTVRLIARNPVGLAGFIGLIVFLVFILIGPLVVPLDTTTKISQVYVKPSPAHPLGTDFQGRDVFSQIVNGGRDLLYVALLASTLTTLISVVFGALSGFIGGSFDSLVMGLTDIVLTIPQFPLLLILASVVRVSNTAVLALILALLSWPTLLRSIRSQVLSIKQRDYVEAARTLDLGTSHIVFNEILPNVGTYIAISFILSMTQAMYAQVGLIYLGLVPFSNSNWAVMISQAYVKGAIFFKDSLLYIMSPIAIIALFQLCLVSLNRSLDEIFNPRLRTGA